MSRHTGHKKTQWWTKDKDEMVTHDQLQWFIKDSQWSELYCHALSPQASTPHMSAWLLCFFIKHVASDRFYEILDVSPSCQ